jgi:arsenite oxidase small subunit
MTDKPCNPTKTVVSRRDFLKLGSAAIVTITLPSYLRKVGMPATFQANLVQYERQVIGKLSQLKPNEPIAFNYPWDAAASTNFLIMLNEPAGGGIGPDQNVVAFNSFCTHQGGPLTGQFQGDKGIVGPCPLHWTTFDMTRHGMVISGHATQGLPQILLELEGDDIVATSVMGLIFGYADNKENPAG